MKALKLIGVIAILLVIIIAGGVAAFVALSDPNDFKEQIAARVLAETGRTLTLEGELEWAFWPKVKLKAGPLALNNAPGFGNEPFFAAHWRLNWSRGTHAPNHPVVGVPFPLPYWEKYASDSSHAS